jgi:hypothetical protein
MAKPLLEPAAVPGKSNRLNTAKTSNELEEFDGIACDWTAAERILTKLRALVSS